MTTRLRLVAASMLTGALTGALALGATPAQAASYEHTDATGDVLGFSLSADEVTEPSLQQRERAADITQLRVRHGKARLTMRLETVALTRRSQSVIGPSFLIITPNRRYTASVDAETEGGSTVRGVELTRGFRRVRCPGLFTDFDFTGNVAMMSVPRSCLGDPQNVRIKAAMNRITFERTRRKFSAEILLDSAMDDGRFLPASATDAIASGPMKAV